MVSDIEMVDSRNLPNSWRTTDNIGNRKRGLPFRFPYVGSFSQQLAEWFIRVYSNEKDTILDPFSGRGTVAMQSLWNGRNIVCNDMSPYSNTLCHSVLYTPFMSDVINTLDSIESHIRKLGTDVSIDYLGKGDKDDIALLYHPDTFVDILRLRSYLNDHDALLNLNNNDSIYTDTYNHEIVMFIRMVMSQLILHSSENLSFNGVKIRGSDNTNVKSLLRYYSKMRVEPVKVDIFERMRSYINKMDLDSFDIKNKFDLLDRKIINCDARRLLLPDKCIDGVITSPPYFDVLNYGMATWARLWVLKNIGDPTINSVDRIETSKYGGIHCSEDYGRNYDRLTDMSGSTVANPGRYSTFTGEYLRELYRVLKDDSFAVIVVGDYGNKKKVDAWRIVADRSILFGFKPVLVIIDELDKSQKSSSQFSQKHGGGKNDNDMIVILYKGNYEMKNNPISINFRWNEKIVDPKQKGIIDAWG